MIKTPPFGGVFCYPNDSITPKYAFLPFVDRQNGVIFRFFLEKSDFSCYNRLVNQICFSREVCDERLQFWKLYS